MHREISRVILHGPLFVSNLEIEGEWHCRALQFDLLGIGATREEAFRQMKELLEIYLEDVAAETRSGRDVEFYHPAEVSEWNVGNIEVYRVVCEIVKIENGPTHELSAPELGMLANRIEAVELLPLEPCAV